MAESRLVTAGQRVRLLGASSGALDWDTNTIHAWCSPLVVGHDVVVGTSIGQVHVYGLESGTLKDAFQLTDVPQPIRGISHDDGVLFATAGDITPSVGGLYAFRIDSTLKWKQPLDESGWGIPPVADGLVYAGCWDGKLYAFNVDGTPAWTQTDFNFFAAEPVVAAGVLYVDAYEHAVALDPTTGGVHWAAQNPMQTTIVGPMAVGDGRVYAATGWGASVCAFDAGTGELLWIAQPGGHCTEPAYWDGRVFVATQHGAGDGYLYALDATSGQVLWKSNKPVAGPGHSVSQPVVDEGPLTSNVFVASQDGHAYAFDRATGLQQWRVPSGPGYGYRPTWTDQASVAISRPFYEAAVDPLSLVLPGYIYAKINLPRPPAELVALMRKAAPAMSAEEIEALRMQVADIRDTAALLAEAMTERGEVTSPPSDIEDVTRTHQTDENFGGETTTGVG